VRKGAHASAARLLRIMLGLPQNNIPKLPREARRFEVLHRRNYYEGAPWAPDCAEDIPFPICFVQRPNRLAPVLDNVPSSPGRDLNFCSRTSAAIQASLVECTEPHRAPWSYTFRGGFTQLPQMALSL
jgi:hypothetical protein